MPILTSIGASSAKAFGFTSGGNNFIVATGGTVTDYNGFRIHRFTSSNDFVITSAPAGATVELFLMAGGGGGGCGSSSGSGGGAGGAYWRTDYPCPAPGTYPIVIGAGGAGVPTNDVNADGGPGGNTTGFGLTVVGGGTQNGQDAWETPGGEQGTWGSGKTYADGGCGSCVVNGTSIASHPKWGDTTNRGRTVFDSTGGFTGSNQTYYYGFAGGGGQSSGAGGGGGINEVGASVAVSGDPGGDGGDGLGFNWEGSTEYFGGGGGGGGSGTSAGQPPGGLGGLGGGGNGNGNAAGDNGVANTGGGGGGSGTASGGSGGSGIVIIKYAIA